MNIVFKVFQQKPAPLLPFAISGIADALGFQVEYKVRNVLLGSWNPASSFGEKFFRFSIWTSTDGIIYHFLFLKLPLKNTSFPESLFNNFPWLTFSMKNLAVSFETSRVWSSKRVRSKCKIWVTPLIRFLPNVNKSTIWQSNRFLHVILAEILMVEVQWVVFEKFRVEIHE